jgi:beta-N-acetylhexosaminidase
LLALVCFLVSIFSPAYAQISASAPDQAAAVLETMTAEERVGQLFLVTFQGNQIDTGSPIFNLITNYHVGGVILQSSNGNFQDTEQELASTAAQGIRLTRQLQQVEWDASLTSMINPTSGEPFEPLFIPIFIGVAQEGDGYPYDQIRNGLTPLPNAMALGATWNPNLATQVGNIAGQELTALGINLLLGPSLDVLEDTQLGQGGNLGTRTFGGDPYWVSEMGRAYIRGVHEGSAGKVAVVAKHFPGHGRSDRLPEEEVATVRKSLDQLRSFELAPFFAVTGNAATVGETVDGLLNSHIRYQGLQGNIRATTRPVSFDPQALSLLLGLPALDIWRQNGGLMISDDLGNQAVRRFYDLTSQTFDARRVALNAFLAGNDLLFIANFTSADEPNEYQATVRTLEFFSQKYRDDSAFAARVDASVLRILTLKQRLYPQFSLESVLADPDNLGKLGLSSRVTFDVAQQAATLISPTQQELDETIPDPPNLNDRIVFITDARTVQACPECEPKALLPVTALQDSVTRLYGPAASGQVRPNLLSSYSLADLKTLLDGKRFETNLEFDLRQANWIVFSMLSKRSDIPSFDTLNQFLSDRPDLFQQKRMIVFAFSAPYYLDATNISKLTAYYGLYSKAAPFVEVAAYLLFGELRPDGASPVSISAIGYDINQVLFPDPRRGFTIELETASASIPTAQTTPEPSPTPDLRLGEVLQLRTGVILDYNGNPVPDGTPVGFVFSTAGVSVRQVEFTRRGLARTTYSINQPGTLDIYAESENSRSNDLRFEIPAPPGGSPPIESPTPIPPTDTPEPTATETQPAPTPEAATPAPPAPSIGMGEWLLAILLSGLAGWLVYRVAALLGHVRWGVRGGFLAFIGGLFAYSVWASQVGLNPALLVEPAIRSALLVTLGGIASGIVGAIIWYLVARRLYHKVAKETTDRRASKSRQHG